MNSLAQLKQRVYRANMNLVKHDLIVLTWGNASAIDREKELVVIKPSGIEYDKLQPEDMVIVNMDGKVKEGSLKPSSDILTHIELYKAFPEIGGVVHTHSCFATAFAQAGKPVLPFGTTHADCFLGPIPCTRFLKDRELADYEKNTGKVIAETFTSLDYRTIPAALVAGHGPFIWGRTPEESVLHAVTLEAVAKMAYLTITLGGEQCIGQKLLDKHYFRKHGKNAYYGQEKNK